MNIAFEVYTMQGNATAEAIKEFSYELWKKGKNLQFFTLQDL